MLICWKFLTHILIIILNLLFPEGFSPGLPYQQEYNPRHLVLLITSFVILSMEQSILRLVCILSINDISDHKMIFTHLPNDSYRNKVNKFIVREKNNKASINNFCNELGSLNINDHLDKRLNLDPNDNYTLFAGLIKYVRQKHLPKIKVKYNKKKHSFLNG